MPDQLPRQTVRRKLVTGDRIGRWPTFDLMRELFAVWKRTNKKNE